MEKTSFEDLNTNSNFKLPKDAGLYWIHCNCCFEIYLRKRRRFLLLSCYHIICENCATTPTNNHINVPDEVRCPICKIMQRYRILCNVMPAHTKELFNPEPWREPKERVLAFQAKHRENFKMEMVRRTFELEKIIRKCHALEIASKQKFERYEQLRNERKQLEREVLKIKRRELQHKSKYFQDVGGDVNRFLNPNNFTGVRRANTNQTTTSSHKSGHTLTRTGPHRSFSLNLF